MSKSIDMEGFENQKFQSKSLNLESHLNKSHNENLISSIQSTNEPWFNNILPSRVSQEVPLIKSKNYLTRVRFNESFSKPSDSKPSQTCTKIKSIDLRPGYRHSNTMPYYSKLSKMAVFGLERDISKYNGNRQFQEYLHLACTLNPELDSDRMRNIMKYEFEDLDFLSSDCATNDFSKLKNNYNILRDVCKKQQKYISLVQEEYIELCKHAETTQEDHYKLETVLRKTIADYARTIAKLRSEYEEQQKINSVNEHSTLKACNAQMASAFSVMHSISNKRKPCSNCASFPMYHRSDSMPRMSVSRRNTITSNEEQNDHIPSHIDNERLFPKFLNDTKEKRAPSYNKATRHSHHSHTDGVLSATFRKSLAKMSPRIAYSITQKITEVIKFVLATYQQEEKFYDINSPTTQNLNMVTSDTASQVSNISYLQNMNSLSHNRSTQNQQLKNRWKPHQTAIGDNELCDLLHNIRALSPTTVRALSKLLHNHP